MLLFPKNPFSWDETSLQVQSSVIGLTLNNSMGYSLNTSHFNAYINIYVPRDATKLPALEMFYTRPLGDKDGGSMQYHSFEINSTSYSMHMEIRPFNSSHSLKVFIKFNERPTKSKFDYNFTVPDFSSCSLTNKTNGTESGQEIIYVNTKKDCQRDPYTPFLSNDQTKRGVYYIG